MTPQTVGLILVLLIITIIGLLVYQRFFIPRTYEGFTGETELSYCPHKSKLFYKGNDMACCEGTVNGNTCEGTPLCGRSGNGLSGLPSCRETLLAYYKTKSEQICPSTMKHFYEDEEGSNAGCTSSDLTSDLTAPKNPAATSCKVYATDAENKKHENSCYNQKLLDTVECKGVNCVKRIVVVEGALAPLIELQFSDHDGDRHVCYTNESYTAYRPESKFVTSEKDPKDCPVLCNEQYKLYLDKDESKDPAKATKPAASIV